MSTKTYRRIALLLANLPLLQIPLSLSAQGPAQLHITPGSYLVMNGQPQLVMNNIAFNNDGDFIAGSSNIRFIGAIGALTNSIMGSTITSFNHLTLHTDPVSGVFLQQDLAVTGDLNMETGQLMLNGHEVSLAGAGQIVGESNISPIEDISPGTGAVTVTRKLFAPQAVNPGNIGIEITANTNLGSTRIVRYFDPQTTLTGGAGIARWFSITPAFNGGMNASARIHYLDHELRSTPPAFLDVWKGSDIMAAWSDAGRSDFDTIQHWVQLDGIDHFNRLTLGSVDNDPILPVTERQSTMATKTAPDLSAEKAQAYPNPSHDQVLLSITSPRGQDVSISVYDQGAHMLQRKMVHLQMGSNTLTWDLSAYPSGIYYLVPESREFKKFKIVRQ
jgi:hypothetical protein